MPALLFASGSRPTVRIQAPKPFQLCAYRFVCEVCGINILRSERGLHRVDENCEVIISPSREICDIESNEHAVYTQSSYFVCVSVTYS